MFSFDAAVAIIAFVMSGYPIGRFIHILLVLAVVVVLINVSSGRRPK